MLAAPGSHRPLPKIRMTFARTIRCLRASLLGLFVVAQVGGIIPLIYDHTLNVFETTPVAGHSHVHVRSSIGTDAGHHHGLLGLHDQCCALHALAGPVPHVANTAPVEFGGVRMVSSGVIAVVEDSPNPLDRPPRFMPLI